MEQKGTIIYVGAFRFPDLDAAAKRVFAIGCILKMIGYNVIFAGGEQGSRDYAKDYSGFKYYSQSELDRGPQNIIGKIRGYLNSGKNTLKWLNHFRVSNKIDIIICYNSNYLFQRRLLRFCKKSKIKIIGDCTEWYDSRHLPGGRWGPISLDNLIKMHWGYPKIHNLIVISSYLAKFYEQKCANLIVVPPLLVLDDKGSSVRPKLSDNSKPKRIIYAGSPGKKDNLIDIVKLIGRKEFLDKLQLTIVGISLESFVNQYNISIPRNVIFLNRITSNMVREHYSRSDFSILFRPNKRYANAGFPTKFVESMGYGVPVITTNTSDLGRYLIDGVNGFWVKNDQEDMFKVFQNIAKIDDEKMTRMKSEAFRTRLQFRHMSFKQPLEQFIKDLD